MFVIKKTPSYVIFGHGGTISNPIYDALPAKSKTSGYKVFAFDHQRIDITDESHVYPILNYIKPKIVINCASYGCPESCESNKVKSFSVNSVGASICAEGCKRIGAQLVYISSSYVFDGTSKKPYSEHSKAKPVNIIGKSKLDAENKVMSASNKNLVIRTGWVFGNNGINFLTSMLSKASSGDVIDVISDCYGSPCYSVDLAKALVQLIDQDKSGIYNVCNTEKCSWADFAYAVAKYSKFDFKIKSWKFEEQKFIDFPMPKFTALSTHKYTKDTGKKMRSWKVALMECLKEI